MAEEKSQAEASAKPHTEAAAKTEAAKPERTQAERDTAKTAVADPGAVPRSDGWTTDTTPEPQPERVIELDKQHAAEAQAAPPAGVVSADRAMAPGALEYSEEQRTERAEAMEAKRQEQAAASAETAQKKP